MGALRGFVEVARMPSPQRDPSARVDAGSTIEAPAFATSSPRIYAAGDTRHGQSLVVWAIAKGAAAAARAQR